MEASDITYVVKWWLVLFAIGTTFLPLTTVIFKNFIDRGYIFSKIIGIAAISYVAFVLGILKIASFTQLSINLIVIGFLILNVFLIFKYPNILMSIKKSWKIFVFGEIIFFSTLFFWSFIHAHAPDIHGLEKYEDFGFINSILRSEYFPPADMWFTPFSINYYYFGHIVTAVLTKLSDIPSHITFNLMLSTIFAFTFTGAFSIGANLIAKVKSQKSKVKIVLGGFLTAFLVSFAGNLHALYTFFKPYVNDHPVPFWQLLFSPQTFPNSYWYPNATRFIENTIHEYPLYSFVVSDLHAHVLDMPFVLFTIALLLSMFYRSINNAKLIQNSKSKIQNYSSKLNIFNFRLPLFTFNFSLLTLLAFMLAVMYMTNVWDGIIYFLLAAIVFAHMRLKSTVNPEYRQGIKHYLSNIKNKNYILHTAYYILLLVIGTILFSLPFNIFFKPFASGIGVLCSPEFLTKIGKFGPFLFEADHCHRSPAWQLMILHGFFYFWVISFVVFISSKLKSKLHPKPYVLNPTDIFVLILIAISTLLIIIPEFIYVKDIYPVHYRANTMFKFIFQSFIMLSISSGYIIVRLISNFEFRILNFKLVYWLIGIIGLVLVFIYPYLAINSYFGNLKTYYGLDGTKYLKNLYPTDYEGILWINKNIKGQPVILEAQGDSYSDYARVSTNTGLPTVLGWTVHEWLWRGSYDIPSPRIPEVQTLYESESVEDTKRLIDKYKIELVFIGHLEKEKYPKLIEAKFKTLGKIVYKNGDTRIYQLDSALK